MSETSRPPRAHRVPRAPGPVPPPFLVAVVPALAATLVLAPGCLAVAAGGAAAAGTAYYRGDLRVDLDAEPRVAIDAARTAAEAMDLEIVSFEATDVDGRLAALTATDRDVVVTVSPRGSRVSTLTIRVGVFGDEALSLAIYDKIREVLPEVRARHEAGEERPWNERRPAPPPPQQ